MINLTDTNISYIIFTPNPSKMGNTPLVDRYTSITHAKGYTDYDIVAVNEMVYSTSFISIHNYNNNDKLRRDAIFILDNFDTNEIIVKYHNQYEPVIIESNGSEKLLSVVLYGSNIDNITTYISDGVSFYFERKNRYYFPKTKSELRKGMIIEMFNNNTWIEKTIENLDLEWDKVYNLFCKYEKIRICRN